jgi:hypothetical protein
MLQLQGLIVHSLGSYKCYASVMRPYDLAIFQFSVPINVQMDKAVQTIFNHCRSDVVFQVLQCTEVALACCSGMSHLDVYMFPKRRSCMHGRLIACSTRERVR